MRLLARDSEAERWFSVLLRSLHLAGVVWLGAAVFSDHAAPVTCIATIVGKDGGLIVVSGDSGGDLIIRQLALGDGSAVAV